MLTKGCDHLQNYLVMSWDKTPGILKLVVEALFEKILFPTGCNADLFLC